MPNARDAVVHTLLNQLREGGLPPGTQLNEAAVAATLGVSRNTLREAFRSLEQQGFLVHHRNRGVFVRSYDHKAIEELYHTRTFLEVAALSLFDAHDSRHQQLHQAMAEHIARAQRAAASGDFATVAQANAAFHLAILKLAGSRHIDELGVTLLTHLRLVFLAAGAPDAVHVPFVDAKESIWRLMEQDPEAAATELRGYLARSCERMCEGSR